MHIFNILIISVQSFKLIARKPWKELITQTCYPMLKADLKIVLSRKCPNFVKNYFFVCKNSHAHLQYIHNKNARLQNDPLKTVRRVDYTNSIPYNAKSCLKWLSSKAVILSKLTLAPSKTRGEPTSRSCAYNNKYLMHQRKVISDHIRKSAVSWVLKVRFLFCKAQLISTNVVFQYQVQLFYEMKLFTRALRNTDIMVSVPKCPSK